MKLKKKIIYSLGYAVGVACAKKQIEIKECDKSQADSIIVKHHYSKKPVKNSFKSFLVYYKGEARGALQLGYGIRPKIKGDLNPDFTREFDRMWLSDEMPKYSESIVISMLILYLRTTTNIKHIISYADTSVGNTGTIYQASNFKLIDKIKADFYVLNNGERVHPVTMWHRHGTRAMVALEKIYPGIRKAEGYQLKFLYSL